MTRTSDGMTHTPELAAFIAAVDASVTADRGEFETTGDVADALAILLRSGWRPPPGAMRPASDRYAMYPLFVDPDGRFSVASAVWGVGQETPIHDHGTWGVIGIVSGVEEEERFELDGGAPQLMDTSRMSSGQVKVCCTTDADVHRVRCGTAEPCIAVHVYGGDIGAIERRAYDVQTGQVTTFVSSWMPLEATAG